MNRKTFKDYSTWLSQASAAISLIIVVFVRSKHVFVSGNAAQMLVLIAMIAAALTFIFGVASLPRWQGFVALAVFSYVAYYLLFTPLYMLS
jgi:type IV secretory pathway VirB2 component (pilin)